MPTDSMTNPRTAATLASRVPLAATGPASDGAVIAQRRPKDEPTHIGAGEPAVGDPAFAFRHEVRDRCAGAGSKRGGPQPLDKAKADQPADRQRQGEGRDRRG